MSEQSTFSALRYHEATKHSAYSVQNSRHLLDWENQPLGFKIYSELEPIALPEPTERDASALDAIAAWPEPGGECVPDLAALARVLFLAAGVTKHKRYPGGEMYFRAYPNTGALYHVDLYLVCGELADLPAGVYHFGAHDFALRRLREGDWRGVLAEASGANPDLSRAPLVVASASTTWRNSWKYQARAWRHAFWDGGTLHANLLAAATSQGLEPTVVLGWADAAIERLLGLDAQRESALALVPLGRWDRPAPPAPEMPELRLATRPLSASEVDYPEIRAAHAGSSLPDGAAAATWRERASAAAEEPPPENPLLPIQPTSGAMRPADSLDAVIRRRGSTRAFDAEKSIDFEQLSTVLDCATRGVPSDFLAGRDASLLDLYLIVNAVNGLEPGAYTFRREDRLLELLREGDFRQAAGGLALGQALARDAAVSIYSLTDLAALLSRHGDRGYRAAQLEGGITGGRMYLAAYAQGFGATGLTFFDDDVTEFFSPHAAGKSVMFLVALGHSARRKLSAAD